MREYKSFKFEVKAFDEASGEFEGIASAFRKTPDKVNDIVQPGAFTKTITENNGEVVLTFPPHNIGSPVGQGAVSESPQGLQVKGTLLRGIQKAEEAYLLMKAGIIKSLSIGYDAVKWQIKDGVRHLSEVKLYEIGLVPGNIAADDQAVILSVKTEFENRLDELEAEIKSGRVLSGASHGKIKAAIIALQELLEAAGIEEEEGKALPKNMDMESIVKALHKSEEPPSGTREDLEAAYLDMVLARVQGGFDAEKAEARLNEIIRKLEV